MAMAALSLSQRKFQAFLSHAHADSAVVDELYRWLNDVAGIQIWYDKRNLLPSEMIASKLPEAVAQCRSMLIVLSRSSVASGWVEEEYNAGIGQRAKTKGFKIIPLRIDECEVPGFLNTTAWVNLPGGKGDINSYSQLLKAISVPRTSEAELGEMRDVYVSRTWRETDERFLADSICMNLIQAGFRLIGDAQDQEGYDIKRITALIGTCGAYVAILPDRGSGSTSKYILQEMEVAYKLGLSVLVVAEPDVKVPEAFRSICIRTIESRNKEKLLVPNLWDAIASLKEDWKYPLHSAHIFFATEIGSNHLFKNQTAVGMLQSITQVPCLIGDQIRTPPIQKTICERIAQATLVIADISNEKLNTCIEAGIARGAGRDLYLVAIEPRQKPPFIFRDMQVWFYSNDLELLGILYRIAYPYRRRVLNHELEL